MLVPSAWTVSNKLKITWNHYPGLKHDGSCMYTPFCYTLIPVLIHRVGMIEWMKKTMPLKEFLQGTMTPQEKTFYESL